MDHNILYGLYNVFGRHMICVTHTSCMTSVDVHKEGEGVLTELVFGFRVTWFALLGPFNV